MSRRFRTLIHVLVAAQILLSAPVWAVTFDSAATSSANMPCADSMPASAGDECCPCCPDGVGSVAGCLSACLAMLGAIPTAMMPIAAAESTDAITALAVSLAHAAEPPLKPPPIR
jgi:hypothetical protein